MSGDVLLEDDIDHARHRVGAIDGGCATSKHLDPFDGNRRDGAEVHDVALPVVRQRIVGHAPAIDQGQYTTGTKAAQIHRVGVLGEATKLLVLDTAGRLGQGGQCLMDGGEAFAFDLDAVDHNDRCRGFQFGPRNARTGHRDRFKLLLIRVRLGGLGFWRVVFRGLRKGRRKRQGQSQRECTGEALSRGKIPGLGVHMHLLR